MSIEQNVTGGEHWANSATPIGCRDWIYTFRAGLKPRRLTDKMECFFSNALLKVRYVLFRLRKPLYPRLLGTTLLLLNPVAYELGRLPLKGIKLRPLQKLTLALVKVTTSRCDPSSRPPYVTGKIPPAECEKLARCFQGSRAEFTQSFPQQKRQFTRLSHGELDR